MSRAVRVPLFLQVPKAEPHRQSISYDRVAAAGVSWTSQAQMLDEVYTIGGYFIAQKAALGHGKFRQWIEGSLGPPLSYRTVRLYMQLYREMKREVELLGLGYSVPPPPPSRRQLAAGARTPRGRLRSGIGGESAIARPAGKVKTPRNKSRGKA